MSTRDGIFRKAVRMLTKNTDHSSEKSPQNGRPASPRERDYFSFKERGTPNGSLKSRSNSWLPGDRRLSRQSLNWAANEKQEEKDETQSQDVLGLFN